MTEKLDEEQLKAWKAALAREEARLMDAAQRMARANQAFMRQMKRSLIFNTAFCFLLGAVFGAALMKVWLR